MRGHLYDLPFAAQIIKKSVFIDCLGIGTGLFAWQTV